MCMKKSRLFEIIFVVMQTHHKYYFELASFFWATIWTRKWIGMPNIVPYHFICKYLHFPQDRKLNPEIEKAINQIPFLGSEIIHEQKKHASASFFLFNFTKFFRARGANCVFTIRISLTIYSRLIKKKMFFYYDMYA